MITTLTVIHIVISVLLIMMVLLQFGKGAEAGLFGGSGADAVFPGSGKGNVLTKITTVLATAFLVLSLVLANLHGKKVEKSIFDNTAKPVLPSLPVNNAASVLPSPVATATTSSTPTTAAPAATK